METDYAIPLHVRLYRAAGANMVYKRKTGGFELRRIGGMDQAERHAARQALMELALCDHDWATDHLDLWLAELARCAAMGWERYYAVDAKAWVAVQGGTS